MTLSAHKIRSAILSLCLVMLAGCADYGGTEVYMTLNAGILSSVDGEHFELFASVNGSAVSLKRFTVRNAPSSEGLAVKAILDFDPPYAELGVTDSLDTNGLLQGGVFFRTAVDLTSATDVFATVELDGESDPAPSQEVIFRGQLRASTRGTRSAILIDPTVSSVRRTNTELGTLTLVFQGGDRVGF